MLRSATSPVTSDDSDLARLAERMFAVMAEAAGVGLAANQIGVDASVCTHTPRQPLWSSAWR